MAEHAVDGTTLLAFYHHHLRDVVVADYLASMAGIERHRALAAHLGDQDLEFHQASETVPNISTLVELPYQQTGGELWDELFTTLTDFRFLERKAAALGVQERMGPQGKPAKIYTGVLQIQEDFARAVRVFPR